MTRIFTASLIAIVAATVVAVGQSSDNIVKRSTTSGAEYYVSNYGIFGLNKDDAGAGLIFPRGSRDSYLFGSGLWFGAIKNVRDTARRLTFITYNANSATGWATPGSRDTTSDDADLYYSGSYYRSTGRHIGTATAPAWPLWLVNGAFASTRYPGTFESNAAERMVGSRYSGPAFLPGVDEQDEQFVSRYHDGDLSRYEGFDEQFGFPLGLQFTQHTYSWRVGRYVSTVVLQYEIVNVSNDTLIDCVIGQASDPDLGSSKNDHVSVYRGSDGKARTGVAFTDAEGAGSSYQALAQILLESPSIDSNGYVDNSRRRELAGSHEIHTFRNWRSDEVLVTPAERYDFLKGPALDVDDTAGDKRTIVAGSPFSMRPGDTAHFAIAFGIVNSPFGGAPASLERLTDALLDDFARGYFYTTFPSAIVGAANRRGALLIRPNPATGSATVEFPVSSPAHVYVSVYDVMGARVSTTSLGTYNPGTYVHSLDIQNLDNGTYLIVVTEGDARHTSRLVVSR